jgi:mannobiose 2-epimerase
MVDAKEGFSVLKQELSHVLENNILKYWAENTVDEEHGGFIGHINSDNTKVPKAGKGIILNTRILWAFSIAYRVLKQDVYLTMADRAYHYIVDHFKDTTHGGVFWEVDFTGNPVNKRKQVYAQAFTIYALAEYFKINKNKEVLEWAVELYELIDNHSHDKENDGYLEAFEEDWSPMDDVRLSEKDANEKLTMNTHLHILEAYTNLIRVWPNKKLIAAQKNLISLFLSKFIHKDGHFNLFFNESWQLKSDIISFGHDIEAAWLLTEAAEVIGDIELTSIVREIAIRTADGLMEQGLDIDGSIFNEKKRSTGLLDYDKHWWPQAEGMVGLLNAYQLSGDGKYIAPLFDLWKFINNKIIDHKQGEWYWKVSKDGELFPEDEKVGFWKCPYHNSRACVEMMHRIDLLIEQKNHESTINKT